jgi:hypothetical protein
VEAAGSLLVTFYWNTLLYFPEDSNLYTYKDLKENITSNFSWLLMIRMLVMKTIMIAVIRQTWAVAVE